MYSFAHVRWFVNNDPVSDLMPLSSYELVMVGIVTIAAVAGLYVYSQSKRYKNFSKWADKKFKPLAKWVPTLTRMSVGLVLVLSAWSGYFFAPNIEVSSDTVEYLSWLLAGLGLLLISGLFVRLAAATLAGIYLISFAFVDPILLFEHIEYLGLAIFLVICGGGELTPKLFKEHAFDEVAYYKAYALHALRIGVGLSLITLAFSEKLLNIHVAQEFLHYHDWNFLSGIGIDDRTFIIIAGTTELILGLLLMFNIVPRVVALLILILFIVTGTLLGLDEIIGHLFAVGFVAAIWANYPKPVKLKQLLKAGGSHG